MMGAMTRQQITILLERAVDWPQEAQEELVRAAIDIEKRHAGVYRLSDEERADLQEARAEIDRGEVATDDEVQATFDELRDRI
jgi:hypothetical protein